MLTCTLFSYFVVSYRVNSVLRVLDLVDIYLDNNPSLSLVLDTIPTLFTLLAFTIKDSHQKPLENRIRYVCEFVFSELNLIFLNYDYS